MTVGSVLEGKPIASAETVGAHETLKEVCRRLGERRIGALMVVDESGRLCGIISERDVVRALGSDGTGALTASVAAHMTRKVETTTRAERVESVLARMTEGRFRHMPVLNGEELEGVVSIGDLVKARIDALERDNHALESFIRS